MNAFYLIKGLPSFLIYLGISMACIVVFAWVYVRLTQHKEMPLILDGNLTAALGFSGVLLGYTAVLASVIAHSVNIVDLLAWALIAAGVQTMGYLLMRVLIKDLTQSIESDRVSVGVLYGVCSLGLGVINAACISY